MPSCGELVIETPFDPEAVTVTNCMVEENRINPQGEGDIAHVSASYRNDNPVEAIVTAEVRLNNTVVHRDAEFTISEHGSVNRGPYTFGGFGFDDVAAGTYEVGVVITDARAGGGFSQGFVPASNLSSSNDTFTLTSAPDAGVRPTGCGSCGGDH